jgi:serine/threonine-protein kinase
MPKRSRSGERYLLTPGELLPGKEQYRIEGFLGQGAFAAAYKAVTETGEVCFIKEYFPASRPSEVGELARVYATERDVVRRIGNYELIPRFWDAFSHEGYSYLVTDFIPGPDLDTVLQSRQKPAIEVLARWCVCLSHELSYLHSRNVVHHDLKPANVRLNTDGDPVLVDFSAAHWYKQAGETTDQLYGSDSYLAPEYQEREEENVETGKLMDVFAMGRIFVELIVGERMTQEEIDRRHEQLYGQILHSGRLDVAFVRAVFKTAAYDPTRRYQSGVELAKDITPAAPPVGRARPTTIHFGNVTDTAPRETNIQCYNVGGGTLRADVSVEGDWLEIGTTGAVTGKTAMFEQNRQSVRVIAYPDRLPPNSEGQGRVIFTFANAALEVPVVLRRTVPAVEVQHQPQSLRLNVPPGAFASARITFNNPGYQPVRVRVQSPVNLPLAIQPEEFLLPASGRQDVMISVDASVLGESDASTALRWSVDGNSRPPIPLQATVRRGGVLSALGNRFRKR